MQLHTSSIHPGECAYVAEVALKQLQYSLVESLWGRYFTPQSVACVKS
jgi:hypothetical protein